MVQFCSVALPRQNAHIQQIFVNLKAQCPKTRNGDVFFIIISEYILIYLCFLNTALGGMCVFSHSLCAFLSFFGVTELSSTAAVERT